MKSLKQSIGEVHTSRMWVRVALNCSFILCLESQWSSPWICLEQNWAPRMTSVQMNTSGCIKWALKNEVNHCSNALWALACCLSFSSSAMVTIKLTCRVHVCLKSSTYEFPHLILLPDNTTEKMMLFYRYVTGDSEFRFHLLKDK